MCNLAPRIHLYRAGAQKYEGRDHHSDMRFVWLSCCRRVMENGMHVYRTIEDLRNCTSAVHEEAAATVIV